MNFEIQVLMVFGWLALIKTLQLGIWPALRPAFGRFAYGAAYPAAVLIFGLGSWYLGLLQLPVQLAVLPFLLSGGYFLLKGGYSASDLKSNIIWDMVFLLPFLFMLEVRFFNPTISFAEKFMDHAFLASIMRAPVIPPPDPWYAGGTLDMYYYLGHWMMGCLGVTAGGTSPVVFNLILPTVIGLTAVSLYSIGRLLLTRHSWLPLLALILVNPAFVMLLLTGESAQTVMWESTRTISNTITEFPLFSFLWGDPHAHVISVFNQAFLIFVLVFMLVNWEAMSARGRLLIAACGAISLGSMPLINSWDVLIYAPVVILFGLLIWRGQREKRQKDIPWQLLAGIPVLSIGVFLPYYLQLNTQGIRGIGLVPGGSDPLQFMLVYGFFIAIFGIHILHDVRKRPYLLLAVIPFVIGGYYAAAIAVIPFVYLLSRKRTSATEILALVGLGIIILTEIVYLMDNMGEVYFRMNTVFKFSMVAWMFMGISGSLILGGWLGRFGVRERLCPRSLCTCILTAAIILLIIPLALPDLSYGYGGGTLDGLAYLEESHPGDAAAVEFLRGLEGTMNIVEAEGGDYAYYSRVSSFTGIPTVIGMPFHEQMWRGDSGKIGERMRDVRIIYERPDEAPALLTAYRIDLVYVGPAERERYEVDLPFFALEPVYTNDEVVIYRFCAGTGSGGAG